MGVETPAAEERQRLAEACAEALWQDDHAAQGLGVRIEAIGPGMATLAMTVTQAMANGHGMCHGGFIFTLADSAFAYACNSHGERAVAQHAAITFLRPARVGERLVATAADRAQAGRTGLTDIEVRGGDGSLVAVFHGQSRRLGQPFFPE